MLQASLQFPTVVFTIGLGIALVYWVFVLLGALDIDLLGGGDAAGAAKGLGEVLTAGKGGAEALKVSGHGDGEADGLLGTVPITISMSVLLLAGWCGSLLLMTYAAPSLTPAVGKWLPAVVLPVTLIVAIVVTSIAVRPLRKVFHVTQGKFNRDYVGHTCTITTGRVDGDFGQANLEDGGTVLVIPVRCDLAPSKLERGDRALILEFDTAREAYVVEPVINVLSGGVDASTSA
ncbi:MAG: hypothetical protein IPI49_18305 [Myxococcales bacterium]|nr:hypothetical protein [Myxococcales bacterium]HRC56417.1 hypothetical protein [Kofleriaceae bacterium]